MRVNLGCGTFVRNDYINFDKYPFNDKVKYIDLDVLPLPFDDCSIEKILMEHTFEHLNVNRFDFMKEIHRVLKPDGIIIIAVPVNSRIITHTIQHFTKNYFNPIIKKTDRYSNCLSFYFEIVDFQHNNFRGITKIFFKRFPFLYNVFPRMVNGEYRWTLKKI